MSRGAGVKRPSRVVFTAHSEEKARQHSRSLADVVAVVLGGHDRRRSNPGEADWILTGGGMVIVYNWPDGQDATTARVVSLWPAR